MNGNMCEKKETIQVQGVSFRIMFYYFTNFIQGKSW
jgi:hypothetical protein